MIFASIRHLLKSFTNDKILQKKQLPTGKQVLQVKSPPSAILDQSLSRIDYDDSFLLLLPKREIYDCREIGRSFLSSDPAWVAALMKLRNDIVRRFHLKTGEGGRPNLEQIKFEVGEQIGIFQVYSSSQETLVLGEDDKHLNFRVLFQFHQEDESMYLSLSTAVQYNNKLGRLYFFFVRPFHHMIVKSMLRKSLVALHNEQ